VTTVTPRARLLVTTCLLGLVSIAPQIAAAQVPTPESHFGFRMGSDGQLASAESIEQYFELVAARSDRVEIVDLGPTTEGHRTIAAIVSAPENIRNLDQIRVANQRLADPRTIPPDEARALAANHKAVLAIGCSIHASESGATQAATELLHALATSTEPETLNVLQNVVVILIPLLNPDGHRRIVSWHQATRNTPFENAPLPWLYHKYAGHDINRDAFMMNLAESRNLARFFYSEWHPQVFLSMHQMDSSGPRMFVPPVADPINRNYDPRIWREAALLGSAMAFQLQRDGRAGVVSNALYDYYWPGYEDSAPLGHNTVCLLTEVASANISGGAGTQTGEARVHKDLFDDRPRMNYPDPWRGDSWTFRDLIDYNLSAVRGLLTAVAVYREQIVQTFYELGRSAIELGQRGGPSAFIVPPVQHDPHAVAKLEELLLQGGVEIHRALEPFHADGESYPAGSDIILLAQPFRAYVKTLLERQDYATLGGSRDGTGMPRPYDVAGWTLPVQMGVDVRTIDRPFSPPPMTRLVAASIAPARIRGDAKPNYYVVDARGNGGAIVINRLLAAGAKPSWISSELTVNDYTYARGSVVVEHSTTVRPMVERIATDLGMRVEGIRSKRPVGAQSIGATRVALYRPWLQDADEGWTRWLLEHYEFQFVSINDGDIRNGDLRKRYDAIILPSMPSAQLLSGSRADLVPPEFAGGLGELGVAALKAFVEGGGTLISLNEAGVFAIEQFQLPLRDVVREASPSDFFSPGSILKIDLDAAHPLSYGMNPRTAGFFSFSSAYDAISHDPTAGGRRSGASNAAVRTVARYGAKDILLSGWLDGEHVIAGRSAAVEVRLGTGRIVLLGFATQHRGQSHATFRLLFNSIFTAG
jgi:hypothetical protein